VLIVRRHFTKWPPFTINFQAIISKYHIISQKMLVISETCKYIYCRQFICLSFAISIIIVGLIVWRQLTKQRLIIVKIICTEYNNIVMRTRQVQFANNFSYPSSPLRNGTVLYIPVLLSCTCTSLHNPSCMCKI
jgi:hypothetical protein